MFRKENKAMNEKERKPTEDMLSEEARSRRQFIKKLGTATFAVTVVGMTGRGAFARSSYGACECTHNFSGETDSCIPERQRFGTETDSSCGGGEGAYQRFATESDEPPPPR